MVLTVTINPLLERRYSYNNIHFGKHHRNGEFEFSPGGKGINVSRQLNCLKLQNLALTFLGGQNGKILRNEFEKEVVNYSFIKIKSETRDCPVIIEKNKKIISAFFGPNPAVTKSEVDEFKLKFDKMIQNAEIVVFSGSSPCKEADSIFPYGIELANKYGKISVCDTYGEHLKNCIEKSPTILHNNIEEIEKSLNVSLKDENDILEFLDWLYSRGIKQSFLTDGENSFYAANFDYHYKVENPVINTIDSTGSGDSFVAGLVYSWHNNFSFEESLSIAVSLGALNATSFEVGNVKPSEIELIKEKVRISPVGKKMKTLDVTPR